MDVPLGICVCVNLCVYNVYVYRDRSAAAGVCGCRWVEDCACVTREKCVDVSVDVCVKTRMCRENGSLSAFFSSCLCECVHVRLP